MDKSKLIDALKGIAELYNGIFEPYDYLGDEESFKSLSDFNGTSLESFVNNVIALMNKEREGKYTFETAGLSVTCDGGEINAYFVVSWVEAAGAPVVVTMRLESSYW